MCIHVFLGESALHEACSYFDTAQFQSERGKFQEKVREKVIEKYENLHCNITDLQVNISEIFPQEKKMSGPGCSKLTMLLVNVSL